MTEVSFGGRVAGCAATIGTERVRSASSACSGWIAPGRGSGGRDARFGPRPRGAMN